MVGGFWRVTWIDRGQGMGRTALSEIMERYMGDVVGAGKGRDDLPIPGCGRNQPGHGRNKRAQSVPTAGAAGLSGRHPAVLPAHPQAATGPALLCGCQGVADHEWRAHQRSCRKLVSGVFSSLHRLQHNVIVRPSTCCTSHGLMHGTFW